MTNADNLPFGDELRQLWEESGLSKTEFAKLLGIPRTTLYSRLEAKQSKPGPAGPPSLGDQITDNERILTTQWITSLDQLWELYNVDLTVWHPYHHVVNYWGNPQHPNTQVKAWLELYEPAAIEPVVSPIQIVLPPLRPAPEVQRDMLLLLNIPDAHFGFQRNFDTGELTPFHDRRALDIAVQIADLEQPDLIVIKGDWMDMTEWTDKYLRSPEYFMTTQPAAIEAAWWLAQFRMACPAAKIVYLKGNHENRLDNIMATHLAYAHRMRKDARIETHPLFSIYTWLGLEELGVEYIDEYPGGQYWVNPKLCLMHGDITRNKPGATAKAVADKEQYSVGFDHIHRMEMSTRKVRTPEGYHYAYAFASGCLCHIDGRVPGSRKDQNWQQGLSLVNYLDTGEHSAPQLVPIYEGVALWSGKYLEARDRVDELRRSTDYVF